MVTRFVQYITTSSTSMSKQPPCNVDVLDNRKHTTLQAFLDSFLWLRETWHAGQLAEAGRFAKSHKFTATTGDTRVLNKMAPKNF